MKVLIIDDHRLFADGIRTLLQEHDRDIDTEYASNIFSSYELINSTDSPNLILLSVNDNARENSFDLIKRLNKLNLEIPVIVISSNNSSSAAGTAIKNNAAGFISKNCSRKTTLEAIISVLDGNMYISKPSCQPFTETQAEVEVNRITIRQKEVLFLLSQGLLNKQIAYELDISANTVKVHLNDLFRRLDVKNRTAAVKYGYEYGLI